MPKPIDTKKLYRLTSPVQTVREISPDDLTILQSFDIARAPWVNDEKVKPLLTTEGIITTDDQVRGDEFRLLASGWELDDYLMAPAVRFMHHRPAGVCIKIDKLVNGLFATNLVFDEETARLIQAGVLKHHSVSFDIDWSAMIWPKNDYDPYISTRHKLVEQSYVDAPSDIGATITDIRSYARSLNINFAIKSNKTDASRSAGGKKMDPEEVKRIADEAAAKAQTAAIDAAGVKIRDVQDKVDKVNTLVESLKDASRGLTEAEAKTLVDRATADFKSVTDELQREINVIKTKKPITAAVLAPETVRDLMAMEPREIMASLPAAEAERVIKFQNKADELLLVDALLETTSRAQNGDYHLRKRSERMSALKSFKQFSEFARAMDSSTSGEGSDWIPTAMSGNLIQQVRLELKLAALFDEIIMPTPSFTIDTQGAATEAEYVGQTTAVVSAVDTNEQTPGTGSMTFTARKLRGRYQLSQELNEDAALAIIPYAKQELVYSIARATEKAIANGDTTSTHFDTGYTVGARDARRFCKGLRYYANSLRATKGAECGTYSLANLRKGRAAMGKYGVYTSDLVLLTSLAGYLYRLLNPEEITQIQTLDKYGPNATILSGEVLKVDNVPVIVSDSIGDNLDANGLYTNAGVTDRTVQLWVNRRMWKRGIRRGVEVTADKDNLNDVWQLVAYFRGDFQPVTTPSASDVTVNECYNIPTA